MKRVGNEAMQRFVVAIDGPAGSGKSTTANECARRLGFYYLDTGAMYRAMTLKVIEEMMTRSQGDKARGSGFRAGGPQSGNLISSRALARLLRSTTVGVHWRRDMLGVTLDGRDVTRDIRAPEVSDLVSVVSAVPAVRRKMVAEQRRIARGRRIVCEGRDIGSVVFPDAELKVFLDCDLLSRAERRFDEMVEKGLVSAEVRMQNAERRGQRLKTRTRTCELNGVLKNLKTRDRIDSSRQMSPLVRVPDAVLVDTTMLSIEEQVRIVCWLVRQRLAQKTCKE
ncbi:MAG: (d)CMP kinase [candidate division WOR-3 bacterium]